MAMKSVWKGSLRVGLLSFPVRAFTATNDSNDGIEFNKLHATCKTKLSQQMQCTQCNVVVGAEATIKGHKVASGNYIEVTAEELDAQKPDSSQIIDIVGLLSADKVDRRQFDRCYYLGPEEVGKEAMAVVREAIGVKDFAIGTITMYSREHLVAIQAMGRALAMFTLRPITEVRTIDAITDYQMLPTSVNASHLKMARQVLEELRDEYDVADFRDQYRENVIALLEAKRSGKSPKVVKLTATKPTADIFAQLQATLAKKKPAKASTSVAKRKSA